MTITIKQAKFEKEKRIAVFSEKTFSIAQCVERSGGNHYH